MCVLSPGGCTWSGPGGLCTWSGPGGGGVPGLVWGVYLVWSRGCTWQIPPRDQVHPPGPGTPPWDQVHPPDQVHPRDQVHPPGPGTPPRTRYPPWTRYTPPWDQPPPLGSGTPPSGLGTPPPPEYGQQAAGTHPTGMHSC